MADHFESFSMPSAMSFEGASTLSSSIWAPGGDMAAFTSTSFRAADTTPTAATDSLLTQTFKQTDATPPVHTELEQGQQPKISVTSDTNKPADFKVKADGTVEVAGKPFDGQKPLSEYKIAVEQGADQKMTEQVVKHIADQISQKAPDAKPVLDAEPGLVSEELRQRYQKSDTTDGEQKDDFDDLPDDKGGIDGGGGGGCDGGGCDGGGGGGGDDTNLDVDDGKDRNHDEGLDRDQQEGDRNRAVVSATEALRNALATNLDSAGKPNYENATAKSLGAYSMNFNGFVTSWLTDEMLEELGHPPDWSKLGKILKKHANDPKFKQKMGEKMDALKSNGEESSAKTLEGMVDRLANDEQFAKGFGEFMQGQEQGRNATPDEMKNFFGKDVQDAAITSQMADVATQMGVKLKDLNEQQASDVALGMLVGHKVSDAEKKQLLEQKMYADYVTQIRDLFKARKG